MSIILFIFSCSVNAAEYATTVSDESKKFQFTNTEIDTILKYYAVFKVQMLLKKQSQQNTKESIDDLLQENQSLEALFDCFKKDIDQYQESLEKQIKVYGQRNEKKLEKILHPPPNILPLQQSIGIFAALKIKTEP